MESLKGSDDVDEASGTVCAQVTWTFLLDGLSWIFLTGASFSGTIGAHDLTNVLAYDR
jgi:hypothetical protein